MNSRRATIYPTVIPAFAGMTKIHIWAENDR